jgi:hypothetical protein
VSKGDFVLGIDPTRTRGVDLRVVVEAKDRSVSLRRLSAEVAEAKENRRAIALAVFTPAGAPSAWSMGRLGDTSRRPVNGRTPPGAVTAGGRERSWLKPALS